MSTLEKLNSTYGEFYERVLPTGSRVICPQAVSAESDEDFLLLVSPKKLVELEQKLGQDGYILGGSLPGGNPELLETHVFKEGKLDMAQVFHSWKRVEVDNDPGSPGYKTVNLLLTYNKEFFEDFARATYLAKALGLTKKIDRVIIFKALTEDNWNFSEQEAIKEKRSEKKYKTLSTLDPGFPNNAEAGWTSVE